MQLICVYNAILSAYIPRLYYYSPIQKQTKMTIGLKHISKATGYAISTVSRVLTNKISEDSVSAKKILRVAREMGYSKYRSVVSPENRVIDIALITQHYSEEFYAYLYSAFEKISIERNCIYFAFVAQLSRLLLLDHIIIRQFENKQKCNLTIHSVRHAKPLMEELLILSKNHDGFILFLPTLDPFGYNKINEIMNNYPIVSIAPSFEAVFDTYTFDSYLGGCLAAKAFLEEGYTKFGIIRGPLQ